MMCKGGVGHFTKLGGGGEGVKLPTYDGLL